MKIKTLVAVIVIAATSLTMWAQDDSTTSATQTTAVNSTTTPDQLFNANEFSLDLFGTVSLNQETINNISGDRISHNGRLGAGAGLTYYATFGQAGAGLDIRITPHWGFFADARYVMPQHVDNFGVGRAGLRLLF